MSHPFPIVRRPVPGVRLPVVVSVPHLGTEPLPHVGPEHYREPRFQTFPAGFADLFAGDLYGDLHEHGATVLTTPISRMFVDVNRRRDDFEIHDGEVRSRRGVVRTHTMREVAIFTRPLTPDDVEARLRAHYDPYYATLGRLLDELRAAHGDVVLLDGHTGSPRRMKDHQVIVGTCRETSCDPALAKRVGAIFERHGFEVHHNVSGYSGGNIVATHGKRSGGGVNAIQIEVNAALLTTTAGDDLVATITRGETPAKAEANIARVRACLREVLAAL